MQVLQQLRGQISQLAPLSFLQCDMRIPRVAFGFIDKVQKAVAFCSQLRRIDLVNITREHKLAVLAGAGNDGFDLVRGEVLRLIHDEDVTFVWLVPTMAALLLGTETLQTEKLHSLRGIGFAPIAVCANGGVIYDPETDRVLSSKTLSVDALCELAEIATRVIPGAGLAVERVGASAHDSATPQFVSSPGYEHAWLNPDNTEVSLDDLLSAPAIKLLVRKAGARSADMAAALAKHIGLEGDLTYSTNNGLIEIVPVGVSKANGIAEIADPLGIPDADWVAFGDMPNDVPMLLRAGLGVAMGNAHPDALAAADEVTTTNADDGVARVLERWWM